MIFIATKADASARNLGRISIKTIDEVSQDTFDVIASYGGKSFTDDQIIAIDDFLTNLKSMSCYSKFTYFVLPILSPKTSKGDLSTDTAWRDNNPCYNIIGGTKLTPRGNNGYIHQHGLSCYKVAGVTALIANTDSSTFNKNTETYTEGACGIINIQDSVTLNAEINDLKPKIMIGSQDKTTAFTFGDLIINNNTPAVFTVSRNSSEAHAVCNGVVGSTSDPVKDPYRGNPVNTYIVCGTNAVSSSDEWKNIISCYFLCNGYMMNEEEIKYVNSICFDLMKALW